jgi:hypothetical protein
MSAFVSKITNLIRSALRFAGQLLRKSPWAWVAAAAMIAMLFLA